LAKYLGEGTSQGERVTSLPFCYSADSKQRDATANDRRT